ncbi:MAG: hypothetical protein ACTSRA_04965 [Promethearchaeota archaeon]
MISEDVGTVLLAPHELESRDDVNKKGFTIGMLLGMLNSIIMGIAALLVIGGEPIRLWFVLLDWSQMQLIIADTGIYSLTFLMKTILVGACIVCITWFVPSVITWLENRTIPLKSTIYLNAIATIPFALIGVVLCLEIMLYTKPFGFKAFTWWEIIVTTEILGSLIWTICIQARMQKHVFKVKAHPSVLATIGAVTILGVLFVVIEVI